MEGQIEQMREHVKLTHLTTINLTVMIQKKLYSLIYHKSFENCRKILCIISLITKDHVFVPLYQVFVCKNHVECK